MQKLNNFKTLIVCVCLIVLVSLSNSINAAPMVPDVIFTVTQPDGTKLNLKANGDEFIAWTTTTDGYTVIKSSDGWYFYAQSSASGELEASTYKVLPEDSRAPGDESFLLSVGKNLLPPFEERPQRQQLRSEKFSGQARSAVTGTDKCMILLIKFPDVEPIHPMIRYDSLFNYNGFKGIGSLNEYFQEVSYGNYGVEGVVNPVWYVADYPLSHYTYNSTGFQGSFELAEEAITKAIAAGVDFSNFDNDGDGIVDGLFIIFTGLGTESGGLAWGDRPVTHETNTNHTVGNLTIEHYCLIAELLGAHPNAYGRPSGIGLFAHEFMHTKGLPDLYGDAQGNTTSLGTWCLMANGLYNGRDLDYPSFWSAGTCPAHLSAWCKSFLGWVEPTVVTQNISVEVAPAVSSPVNYRIWTKGNTESKEYFLAEYRINIGFDSCTAFGCGLLIYHVNDNFSGNSQGSQHIAVEDPRGSLGNSHCLLNGDSWQQGDIFDYQSSPNSHSVNGLETGVYVEVSSHCGNCWNPGGTPTISVTFDVCVGTQDNDSDGVINQCDNCINDANATQTDSDGDGNGDPCDICPGGDDFLNSDVQLLDSLPDFCDNCPFDYNENQTDVDGDGVGDSDLTIGINDIGCDNCEGLYNPNQVNSDTDAFGDLCDNCILVDNDNQLDGDGDLVGDVCDNCPNVQNSSQLNSDTDNLGDVCDNCPLDPNPSQIDENNNSVGDVCDIACCYLRGDVNHDGAGPNILDLTYFVDFLNRGGLPPPCKGEADVNDDGNVNVIDLTYIVDILFRSGPPPVPCP